MRASLRVPISENKHHKMKSTANTAAHTAHRRRRRRRRHPAIRDPPSADEAGPNATRKPAIRSPCNDSRLMRKEPERPKRL